MLRVSRALAVAALAALAAGCGGSHSAASTTTTRTSTAPKTTLELVAANFPPQLAGSLTYRINSTQGNPKKPGGYRRNYTVALNHVVMRLAKVSGKGNKRTATYTLVTSKPSFSGHEDVTNSKCQTTHIVWGGARSPSRGILAVYGPKFDSPVTFQFLVPQSGAATTLPCNSSSGGTRKTVTRTASIQGSANLRLQATKVPTNRFSIGIEIQSSTAGARQSGGYTIQGMLAPSAAAAPVKLCRQSGDKLTCPA